MHSDARERATVANLYSFAAPAQPTQVHTSLRWPPPAACGGCPPKRPQQTTCATDTQSMQAGVGVKLELGDVSGYLQPVPAAAYPVAVWRAGSEGGGDPERGRPTPEVWRRTGCGPAAPGRLRRPPPCCTTPAGARCDCIGLLGLSAAAAVAESGGCGPARAAAVVGAPVVVRGAR